MDEADSDMRVLGSDVVCHMLCAVDRAVLAACASESYHEVGESAFDISFHVRVHDCIDVAQEFRDLTVFFEEADHRLVSSRQFLIWLISSWVVDGPAVKGITSAISRHVLRKALPV